MSDNADQVTYWNEKAAVTWTALQDRIDALFTPITQAAIAAAAPRRGEHALDVGCGCGATVLELGRLVAPNGTVLGVDVSVPMLGRARERVAAAALKGVNLVVSDAQTYEFPRGAVDLLFSRFGVMFFADPVAAFTNLRRTMKQGGRLLFACWRPMAENSWFHVPLNAAKDLLPAQPPADPLAPGPFAFADPERVKRVLAEAGWQDVSATPFDAPMKLAGPGQLAEASEFATRVGALARMLGEVDEETRQRARAAVTEALKAHETPEGFMLGGAVWLVAASA